MTIMTIIHWLVSAAAVGVAAYLIPGVEVTLVGALIAAVVIGIINLFIKPVLTILTLPLTIVTLGLFSLVLNALLVLLVAQVVPGFTVTGFWPALFFSIVLSLVNAVFDMGRD
jgi:putative membrane protein